VQRISTWIDKLDHEIPGVRRHYNYLSDMVHPNYLGTFRFFASLDSATGTVSFSETKRRDKNTLEAISTPLMLIVLAKECFEQFDGFIKQVADLQHSGALLRGPRRMHDVTLRGENRGSAWDSL